VIAQFSVNNKGEIINIKARGPHKIFEDEAIRVIKELPTMPPQKGSKEVQPIKFTLPITMVIETDAEKIKRKRKELKRKKRRLKKR